MAGTADAAVPAARAARHRSRRWSSLEHRDAARTITVEQVPLADLLQAHAPQVLAVDIEGHERQLVGTPLPSCLRCVLMEIHTPDIGTAETARVVAWLTAEGFVMRDVRAYTWAFERNGSV